MPTSFSGHAKRVESLMSAMSFVSEFLDDDRYLPRERAGQVELPSLKTNSARPEQPGARPAGPGTLRLSFKPDSSSLPEMFWLREL